MHATRSVEIYDPDPARPSNDQFGDPPPAQIRRTNSATVQEDECLPRQGQPSGKEHSMCRKTGVQAEADKQGLTDDVPVRE